jgi:hypothetical protein
MRRALGNRLGLGMVDGKGVPLEMTPQMRSTHLYVCGATGVTIIFSRAGCTS